MNQNVGPMSPRGATTLSGTARPRMSGLEAEVLAVPPELKGFVVSKPALEIPKISAKSIRETTELHLGHKVSAAGGRVERSHRRVWACRGLKGSVGSTAS
jgi:hypothetical protein